MRGSLSPLRFALAAASLAALLTPLLHAQDDPPPQAGRLSYIYGNVSIQPAGAQDWGQAYPNFPVGPGDRIFTDDNSRAEIQVGRSYVRIGPDSDVTFVNYDFSAVTFGIAQGALHVRTRGLWDQQSLYVQTPSGTSTVTGPADFRVDVIPSDQVAIFTTYDGDQYLSGAGGFGTDTPRGQSIELIGTNPVYPQWLQPAGADDLDQWSEQRDQQIFRAASFRYVSEDVPGAWDLDASGQWTPGTEYGNIWFPNVQPGWAPYHNGHWVDHEPWGFVWVEDESWGYAPFHYGRWVNYHNRWGWIPGPLQSRPVWSPALVAFAGGISIGGGGVSVWFPLGPGEPYRPWYPCSSRYIDQVNIANIQPAPQVRVEKTYVNIVNVTNVTNITYVNRSIGATAIRQQDMAAGRPVAQAAVHVDAQQLQHAQVIARPQVVPTRTSIIARPPARPVPVAAARPVLINARGQAVVAQPKAQPAPPPVRPAPAPRPLPGRAVVAPPPNVKMTPAARQAVQSHPPAQLQQQPNRPGQPANATQPGRPAVPPPAQPARPVATPPAQPARPNQPPPQTQPRPNPVPATRPPAQPVPSTRPAPTPQPPAPQRPAPEENRPASRPQQPPPAQPQRPAERPPAPVQAPRTPPPQAQPQRPAPPENRPAERPATPPPSRPAPPPPARTQPEPRPNPQPEARPAPRQNPPPEKKKPEDKKPEEERKP